jgi:hypothetical protein
MIVNIEKGTGQLIEENGSVGWKLAETDAFAGFNIYFSKSNGGAVIELVGAEGERQTEKSPKHLDVVSKQVRFDAEKVDK